MFKELKTDPAIAKRLRKAAKKKLGRDELEKQRVSFVYGNMPAKSNVTRQQVEKKIKNDR